MNKLVVVTLFLFAIILTGCYEGRGYAYEHLNAQNPGKLRTEDPGREEVGAEQVAIGGTYEHLQKNLCGNKPECCGDFTDEQQWYKELQQRAAVENNVELCDALPDEAFVVDCPGEQTYEYYNKETCKLNVA